MAKCIVELKVHVEMEYDESQMSAEDCVDCINMTIESSDVYSVVTGVTCMDASLA